MEHTGVGFRVGVVTLSLLAAAGDLTAATVVWQGTGGDDFWSNPANWTGGIAPRDGDDVVFGASPSFQAIVDDSVRLASFTYATDATATDIHVGGGRPSTLTFSGAGIVNDTPFVSGQPLQSFYADAGSGTLGATLIFANTASIYGSVATTLTASGATMAGSGGGTIVFQDHASTAVERNFNGLIAAGATVAGAGGGTVILRGDALAQDTTQVVARAGNGTAAAGGQITVQDRARIESNVTVLQGENGGYGGRLDFHDSAVLVGGLLENFGANSALAGGEAVTRFFDNARFGGAAENFAGGGTGFAGGRMEFHGLAVFDGGLDTAQIINQGGFLGGALSGRTIFYDDSSATQVGIFNETDGEATSPGTMGGVTEFHDRSHAGQASIVNDGANASAAGTLGGRTLFFDNASAASASITNSPGYTAGAPGGVTVFADHSTAGNATIAAYGVGAGLGGQILFQDSASGGTARIITNPGGIVDISALTTPGTTVGSLEGGGTFRLGGKTLTVGGNNLSTEVTGVLRDGGQAGGAGGALTKVGTGTLTLSGANAYTGGTIVNAGTLDVNGAVQGSGVTVTGGSTLGGSGTISAPVQVGAGATLAPGSAAAPGALTIAGNLGLDPASSLNYRLGAPGVVGGPLNDLLTVSGNLALGGTLNVANSGGFGLGSYRLIDYGGALTNNGLAFGTLPSGFSAADLTLQTSVGGQINLVVGGAAVLFWDGTHVAANGLVDGGSGTWNSATTNWTNAGGTVNVGWGGTFAVFAGAAGTVTVSAPVSTTGMQFATSGYTVGADPGASIALVGAATVRVNPGASATLAAPLVGTGSLVKVDTGTLTLAGSSSYSGGTTLQDGLVIVTNPAGTALGTGPVTLFATATQELDFVGTASAGGVSITARGAPSTAVSAYIRFKDNATAGSAAIDNQGNTASGGFGGQLNFVDASSAGSATIVNRGSAFARPTGPFADNGAGTTIFVNNTTAGSATLVNTASLAGGALGGHTFFTQTSTAGTSSITNEGGAFAAGGFGATLFSDASRAGGATITNLGTTSTGAGGGYTEFGAGTTADSATFINRASALANGAGGYVQFLGNATAGSATFTQSGGSAVNATIPAEGAVVFENTSSAASSRFDNLGATAAGAVGGLVVFNGSSTAGNATITNRAGALNGGFGGNALFDDSATAGSATLTLEGGTTPGARGGTANFSGNATAANATLIAQGGSGGGTPGVVSLGGSASGGTARVVLDGGSLDIAGLITAGTTVGSLEGNGGNVLLGGKRLSVGGSNTSTLFGGSIGGSGALTKAGTGSLTLTGVSTYTGGTTLLTGQLEVQSASGLGLGTGPVSVLDSSTTRLFFTHSGSAGALAITDQAGVSGGGFTVFADTATAASSTITNRASIVDGGGGGYLRFIGNSNAGSAHIGNDGTAFGLGGFGASGATDFDQSTSAADATITNGAALKAGQISGQTRFFDDATAGNSRIFNDGATVLGGSGGATLFYGSSSADHSVIVNTGASAGGGINSQGTFFTDSSTAGNATLYAYTSTGAGAGGSILFSGSSTGGAARVVFGSTGTALSLGGLDISDLVTPGMTLGSLEGKGIVSLGSKALTVGLNNASTTFSGLIRDGGFVGGTGGSLTVAGAGAVLTLTGANTYTGGTRIGDGVNANSGKLVAANSVGSATGTGPVVVERGGTLGGTGLVAGPVTLKAGGLIAPGDPATLTFAGDLTWDGGGVIQLVLGADQAGSDFLSILGHLIRGADGEFRFNLIDAGFVAGRQYELIGAGALDGFAASDFTVSGIAGDFAFVNGALDFSAVAAPVPEPGTVWMMLGGLLLWAGSRSPLRSWRCGRGPFVAHRCGPSARRRTSS